MHFVLTIYTVRFVLTIYTVRFVFTIYTVRFFSIDKAEETKATDTVSLCGWGRGWGLG